MNLTCPQCGHSSVVMCACHDEPLAHLAPCTLVCTKCSAVNRLDRNPQTGKWGVRVPDIAELDQLLARPDIMVGLEEIRRRREART